MNNILAFELADFRLSIALMKAGNVVEEFRSESLYGQDAELLPEMERMLNQYQISYHQLDLIATTKGPGSFTGLRVALATAEGLSLASGKCAVAFNSLEWIARQYITLPEKKEKALYESILVSLESKRKDVYCQLFNMKGEILRAPASLLPDEVEAYIEKRSALCIGSGRDKLMNALSFAKLDFPDYLMPTAKDLCYYAQQQVTKFGTAAFPCEPFYLRMPDATLPKT